MFCPKCGKEIIDGSTFCGGCGYRLGEAEAAKETKSVPKKAFAAAAIVIIVIAAAALLVMNIPKKTDGSALYTNGFLIFPNESVSLFGKDGTVFLSADYNGEDYTAANMVIADGGLGMYRTVTISASGKTMFGFSDKSGSVKINPQFDYAYSFDKSGLAAVKLGDKWGYADTKGKYAINAQFDEAFPFGESELAAVVSGGRYGYIDKKGKYVITAQFDKAYPFDGANIARVVSGGKFGYIDKKGKYTVNPQFDDAYDFDSSGLALVSMGGKYGFIKKDGSYAVNPQFDFAGEFAKNGLALVMSGDKFGYINKKGDYVINPQFDDASSFADNGLAVVSMNGRYGYINKKGEFEINPQFDMAYTFSSCGAARVKNGEKYFYIGKNGNRFGEEYDAAFDFCSDGYAPVYSDGGVKIIDSKGNYMQIPAGGITNPFSVFPRSSEYIGMMLPNIIAVNDDYDSYSRYSDWENLSYESESISGYYDMFSETEFDRMMRGLANYYNIDVRAVLDASVIISYEDRMRETANVNAKLAFTNAAVYCTNAGTRGNNISDKLIYGSLSEKTDDKYSQYDGSNSDFIEFMRRTMGGENVSGYFAVKIENYVPAYVYWSSDRRLIDEAEAGNISSGSQSFGFVVGGYPYPQY